MGIQLDMLSIESVDLKFGVIDCGNSRIKILFGDSFWVIDYYLTEEIDSIVKIFEEIQLLTDNNRIMIYYSSVNLLAEKLIIKTSSQFPNIKLISISEKLQNQKILQFDHIIGIGSDRVLGLIAAVIEYGNPIITVDCGTAITINVAQNFVKTNTCGYFSNCEGGVIFAGIKAQVEGLNRSTTGLDLIVFETPENILGKTSLEAMNSGIINSLVGSIKHIIKRIEIELLFGSNFTIVITGGSSSIIAKLLQDWDYPFVVDEKLVLKGIKYISH
jgi:pantothenate kinase type III